MRPSRFCFDLSLITYLLSRRSPSLTCLAGLAADSFVDVPNALALVGLGLAQRADVGGHLADQLLVDAVHLDTGGLRHHELDALGGVDHDGVAEAERQVELV